MVDTYCQQIGEMQQTLRRMRPRLVSMKGPVILHENTRPHVAKPKLLKFNEFGDKFLPHRADLLDLSPTNYHFSRHPDIFVHDKCLKNEDGAKHVFTAFLVSRGKTFLLQRYK